MTAGPKLSARLVAPIAVLLGSAWVATGSAALPTPEQLPPNTVARVSHVPHGLGTITRAEFRRALAQTAAANGFDRVPGPSAKQYEGLARRALTSALEVVFIRGQAAEMGIVVKRREVRRAVAGIKAEFDTGAEYRRFLRDLRLTRRDVYDRMLVQIIATRIQSRLPAEEKALEDWFESYQKRWRGRTACAPGYESRHC